MKEYYPLMDQKMWPCWVYIGPPPLTTANVDLQSILPKMLQWGVEAAQGPRPWGKKGDGVQVYVCLG